MFVPAVQERFVAGFTPDTVDSSTQVAEAGYQDTDGPDLYTVTSGRTIVWPYVIQEIRKKPLVGHGREAMLRTGLGVSIWRRYGESFPHPHNAYLQWLLDNGIIGFIPVMLFYLLVLKGAASLFLDKNDPECRAIGGITLALVGALLVASMGSQTFYPREGALPMWCAMGLTLRCYVLRKRWLGERSPQRAGFGQLSGAT
jgi:O-antigen ligase